MSLPILQFFGFQRTCKKRADKLMPQIILQIFKSSLNQLSCFVEHPVDEIQERTVVKNPCDEYEKKISYDNIPGLKGSSSELKGSTRSTLTTSLSSTRTILFRWPTASCRTNNQTWNSNFCSQLRKENIKECQR